MVASDFLEPVNRELTRAIHRLAEFESLAVALKAGMQSQDFLRKMVRSVRSDQAGREHTCEARHRAARKLIEITFSLKVVSARQRKQRLKEAL